MQSLYETCAKTCGHTCDLFISLRILQPLTGRSKYTVMGLLHTFGERFTSLQVNQLHSIKVVMIIMAKTKVSNVYIELIRKSLDKKGKKAGKTK